MSLESPSVVLLSESEWQWENPRDMLTAGRIAGPMVHDARIAVLFKQPGVVKLWSTEGDFSRFAGVRVRNPLVA